MRHKKSIIFIDIIIGFILFVFDYVGFISRFSVNQLISQYGFSYHYITNTLRFVFLALAILLFLIINEKVNAQPIDVLISCVSFIALFLIYLVASDLRLVVISFWLDSIAILISFLIFTFFKKSKFLNSNSNN